MHMRRGCLFALLLASANVQALDGFEKVQCSSDIPKALIGQRTSNEASAAIEGRHAALGLKDLGGSEVSDRLFSASWRICGNEYALLLDDRSVIRDALKFPPHSKASPGFIGACQVKDKKMPGTVIAVLKDEPGTGMLAAQAAWRIDEASVRFVAQAAEGLRCPRDGIFTADGGR